MTRFYAKACGLTDAQYLNLRATILFKQDFKCNRCQCDLTEVNTKKKTIYELSHIIPDLDQTNEENCEVLCTPCHAEVDPQRRLKGQTQAKAWSKMGNLETYTIPGKKWSSVATEGGD